MGRPSKSRSDTSTNAPYDQWSTSPVNLSFHAGAGTSGVVEQNGPAASLEVSAARSQRDVVSQQPDSTADCSPPSSGAGLAVSSRKRSTVNVLRQLQSQSAAASHAAVVGKQSSSSALWPDCAENVAMIDVAADLRIKRARHSVQSPVRLVTGPGGVRVAELSRTGEGWSMGDIDSCTAAAAAIYDTAVASPSVTSSGRRDSVDDGDDDDDDDEDVVMRARDCATWMTACPPPSSGPAACSVDLRRHITRRSSADQPAKKLAG